MRRRKAVVLVNHKMNCTKLCMNCLENSLYLKKILLLLSDNGVSVRLFP